MSKTTLYRFFDEKDQLLYVGISKIPLTRFDHHVQSSKWFPLSVRCTVEHYLVRQEAEAAERLAIQTEDPMYNIHHKLVKP